MHVPEAPQTDTLNSDNQYSSLSDLAAPDLTALYLKARSEFRKLIKRAERISRGSGGIPSTGNRMFWSSILFMRLSVTAKSLDILLPDPKPREHWDFGAVASLARVLLEAAIVYNWLCGDKVDDDERKGRFILLYLHDYGSRRRLFPDDFKDTSEVCEDLVRQFDENTFLQRYDAKQRRVALRGEKTPFIQDDVLIQMENDPNQFRLLYRFLSQHTHTGPMAFYRIMEHDRGSGVETKHEKRYMLFAINAAWECLNQVIDEHLLIFPDAETRPPHLTPQQIEENVEVAQGRRKPRNHRRPV
ncbi:DUF5677 domain-containing protein [Sphingomonas faeni]|uniref:DUF5677 domain-containing protein n=1 Tax=Sphingomonas faeni TaxID=185950 RepID=UPI00334C4A34